MAKAFISEIVRMKQYLLFFVLLFSCSGPKLPQATEASMDALMDEWHQAAHEANEEAYFSLMTADAVFIGTDASERWLRDELRLWAKEAFSRNSAWSFTVRERNWQAQDGFWICDELLDTGMGLCRASAVLVPVEDSWKIQHYQLSLTVPNEKIPEFKILVE